MEPANQRGVLSDLVALLNENGYSATMLNGELLIDHDAGSCEVLTSTYHKIKEHRKVSFFNMPSNLDIIGQLLERFPLTNPITFCSNKEKNQQIDRLNQMYMLVHAIRLYPSITKVYFITETDIEKIKQELSKIELQFGGHGDDLRYTKFTAALKESAYLIFLNVSLADLHLNWATENNFDCHMYFAYEDLHNNNAPAFPDVIKDEDNFNYIVNMCMSPFSEAYRELKPEQLGTLDETLKSLVAISEPKQASQFVKIVENCFRLLCKESKSFEFVFGYTSRMFPVFEKQPVKYNQSKQSKQSSQTGQTNTEIVEKNKPITIKDYCLSCAKPITYPNQLCQECDATQNKIPFIQSSEEKKAAPSVVQSEKQPTNVSQIKPSAPPIETNEFPDPEADPIKFLMINYNIDMKTATNLNKLLHLPSNGNSLDIFELIKKAKTMN